MEKQRAREFPILTEAWGRQFAHVADDLHQKILRKLRNESRRKKLFNDFNVRTWHKQTARLKRT